MVFEANNPDAHDRIGWDHPEHRSYLSRQKLSHILKAARTSTIANILAPLLCIPLFKNEARPDDLVLWLIVMAVTILIRTVIIFRLENKAERISDPEQNLHLINVALGIVGLGWGLGWLLIAPELHLFNRMIYIYGTTAAMIASMFAYSVSTSTFYAFNIPIMCSSLLAVAWGANAFPWPFAVGLATLYLVVLGISRSFSRTFEESIHLRFRNQQLYQELARERDESIAANIAKSKFIAVASHDLRQPLHAVNINMELFDLSDLSEKNLQILRKIKNSMMGLSNMFEGLMNMSKLDSFASHVNHWYFDVNDLSDAIKDTVESRVTAKGLLFHTNRPSFIVHGDKLLLQQLLVNLAMNAIQYTDHGKVEVLFSDPMGHLNVDVIDSGVGISTADQRHIFNEFFRAEQTRDAHEGLGLGLSIVKRLSQLMEMSIHLESRIGEGSRFTLRSNHPIVHAHAPENAESTALPAHVPQTSNLNGKVIAIIEDDEVIMDAYRQTLQAQGASIVVFSEHAHELQLQLESVNRIDCILSDYQLQQTDGIAVIERIRDNFNSDIPAVIVTGDISPTNIKALEAFQAVILYKPLTLSKIIESMVSAIDAH